MRSYAPPSRPVGRHVRPAFLADARAEAHERRGRHDLAGDERLSLPEARRPGEQARRDEGEDLGQVADIADGVHSHQEQVVALRDDVLVHLLRPLGREEEVEPELAPLGGDLDRRFRGEELQPAVGELGAHVVRLVDDDEQRSPFEPPLPEAREDGLGDERLLGRRAERADVDDEAAPVVPVEVLEDGARLLPRPDAVAVDAEVADPAEQAVEPFARRFATARRERLVARGARPFLECAQQLVVLDGIADRVELEDASVRGAVELREANPEPALPLRRRRANEDRGRERSESCCERGVGAGARLTQAHEIGVGVDHDDPQLGVEQKLLEDDAKRVRLARARLPAEERMPIEAAGVDPCGHRLVPAGEHRPDHELRACRGAVATAPRPRGRSRPRSGRRRTGRRRPRARPRFPPRCAPAPGPGGRESRRRTGSRLPGRHRPRGRHASRAPA